MLYHRDASASTTAVHVWSVNFCLGRSSSTSNTASSTRPLISGSQGCGHGLVAYLWTLDSTLNNWLIELTVCPLNGFVCTRTLVRTSNLQANIHIVPIQFACQKQQTLSFCKVGLVWRHYLGLGKVYPRHCISVSIKIGQVSLLYSVSQKNPPTVFWNFSQTVGNF